MKKPDLPSSFSPNIPPDLEENEANYIRILGPSGEVIGYQQINDQPAMPVNPPADTLSRRKFNTIATATALSVLTGFAIKASKELAPQGNEHLDEATSWEYTVQDGDSVWSIVEKHYENTQPVYLPTWMHNFIENNVQNVTADEDDRDKIDLRPGDKLIITDPPATPEPED